MRGPVQQPPTEITEGCWGVHAGRRPRSILSSSAKPRSRLVAGAVCAERHRRAEVGNGCSDEPNETEAETGTDSAQSRICEFFVAETIWRRSMISSV
jgi:hypothetical protein